MSSLFKLLSNSGPGDRADLGWWIFLCQIHEIFKETALFYTETLIRENSLSNKIFKIDNKTIK